MSDKAAEAKVGIFRRIGSRVSRWFREMRSELKKVVWPTPKQLTNNTIIVIVAVLLVGLVIAGVDTLFIFALDLLRNAF